MKRYIRALLITVLCVPLLCVQVFAADLYFPNVIPEDYLPNGYMVTKMPVMEISESVNEVIFYDTFHDAFIHVRFDGDGNFAQYSASDLRWTIRLSNPNSVKMRLYPCNGRDIFTFTAETSLVFRNENLENLLLSQGVTGKTSGVFRVNGRSTTLGSEVGDNVYIYKWSTKNGIKVITSIDFYKSGVYTNTSNGPNVIGSLGTLTDQMYVPVGEGTTVTLSPAPVMPSSVDFSIDKDIYYLYMQGFVTAGANAGNATINYDYYVVQKQGSGVKTSIDYSASWSYNNGLQIGGMPLVGYPVAVKYNENMGSKLLFIDPTGKEIAKLKGISIINTLTIENQSALLTSRIYRLSLSLLNRYLMHFGYEAAFYSESNTALSSDISGLGGTVNSWSSQAGAYSSQAANAVNGVTASINSAKPIFTSVWGVFPSWVWALLAFSLAFAIGRKVLGR